jgi:DNA-binding MarR family transcriptional regulator
MDHSTLSRNVERMRARGWLEAADDRDGRASPFRVTKRGRQLLKRVLPAWEKAQEKAVSVLGEDGARMLARAVGNVRRSETQP